MNQTSTASRASSQDRAVRQDALKKLAFAGIFAALTYIVFTFFSIPVPTIGGGKVTVHLGNAFCVLGALLLGARYGAVGGALGLTLADLLDPVYIVEAPITFAIKLLMGIIVALVAHKLGKISREQDQIRVMRWVTIAAIAGLAFNAIFDPLLRYFYKILVMGKPAAEVSFAINFGVTLVNSITSAIIAVLLYAALRPALKKAGLFFEL